MDSADPLVFDSAFLSKLEQLYLLSKKIFRGQHRAERRSRQTGSSLEFADYRNYALGDDLRAVDWNVYGRLERLFVKLFEEEQDLHIYFLIDASASMRWQPQRGAPGGPQFSKFDQARRVAASLAYIGLANLDRVNVYFFSGALGEDLGIARGKSQFHKVLEFLKRAPAANGSTRLLPVMREFSQRVKRRGLVIVLSDLFDFDGYEEAFGLLRYRRFEVQLVHMLDPAELAPELAGDLRLTDSETGERLEITADSGLLARYQSSVTAFLADLERYCVERQIGCVRATSDVVFEDLVLRVLRNGVLVQ